MNDTLLPPCLKCGAPQVEPGRLQGKQRTGFRPERIKFFTFRSTVKVDATMCRACGRIELSGDPQQLENMLRQS